YLRISAHACLSFNVCVDPRDLYSFPTRRSSDLAGGFRVDGPFEGANLVFVVVACVDQDNFRVGYQFVPLLGLHVNARHGRGVNRSEEHTSELQSRENLVCRLLLEKKKANKFKII